MRKGWLIMIICLMMTLNGCSVEKNIVSENNNEILQLEVDKEGAIIIEEEYPKLKVSVELFNEGLKEKLKEMKEKYETEVYCSVSIQRADAYTLSFFAKYCIEDNGNTICQMMETWNYNTETGSFINLEDVFIDGTRLPDMLQTQLMNDCVLKDNSDNVDEQIKSALSDERELKWTIGYQGITFYIPILFVGNC